ncbi:MAG TPA: type 2 lanthipeptide synthetase LanM family protein [Pyrinomonadaceae bacterium]|jgi:type 2 lantibiotic biosynthesis protein LanM
MVARRRFERWRAQPPFDEEDHFVRRLEADGLTEEALLLLLGESPASLAGRYRERPEWLAAIERAFSGTADRPEGAPGAHAEAPPGLLPPDGFLRGVAPLIEQCLGRVTTGAAALAASHPVVPFNPATAAELFLPTLLLTLAGHASRTIVLELNVARLRGELVGETPEERFKHFNRLIAQAPNLLPVLHEYPVLARQVVTTVEYWVRNCLELLGRLCADWAEIAATLSPGVEPGPLNAVSVDAGDSHREGRSVKILEFRDGLKVVYKPHPLSVDTHFNELLEWLNRRGASPAFRTLKVIDRGGHGWVEFVEAGGCRTREQVRRFYQRQGGQLALLYALEATDFHFENLIAAGEHPVLVDLESLFQPRPPLPPGGEGGALPASQAFANSVMRIGLLPQRIWAVDQKLGVDMSGLGGGGGQLTPFPVLTMENLATDELRFVRKHMTLPGSKNLPSLDGGGGIDLQEYAAEVVAGFTSTYRLLLRERESLLAPGGLLENFGGDEVRAILRATQTYTALLMESFHPDVLRDALDRCRLFDRLWEGCKANPVMRAVVPAEIRELQKGDVPFFSSRPGSRDLWSADGERFENFFQETSLDRVRGRVRQLSEEDLGHQVWFISASISSLTLGDGPLATYEEAPEAEAGSAGRERLLSAAGALADRLGALALRSESSVNWIGLSFVGQRQWTLIPLSPDLYNGTLGVALFLAYAGQILGDERHTALARLALDGVRRQLAPLEKEARRADTEISLGGYNGLGSVIYTLAHAGALWGDPEYFAAAESLVELVPPLVANDQTYDVISGGAGCILNLLALRHCTGSEAALAAARRCAEHILAHARPTGAGLAWHSDLLSSNPLTGFSHGAAGIAHALLELAAETGEERYERCARGAFEYERSVFSPERGNWPDFREEEEPGGGAAGDVPYMTTWCHGSVGIGLSRLHAMRHIADGGLRAEVDAAVRTTLAEGFGRSHSICHGDVGNLEFLFEAGRTLGDEELVGRAARKMAAVLGGVEKHGWVCGTPRGIETPGLMTGLAGIGYGLLRIAEPGRVPSVLTLGRPATRAAKVSDQPATVVAAG